MDQPSKADGIRIDGFAKAFAFLVIVWGGAFVALWAICERAGVSTELPNGHRIVYIHNESAVVARNDGLVLIPSHVVYWTTAKGWVVGSRADGTYFALDTKSGMRRVDKDVGIIVSFLTNAGFERTVAENAIDSVRSGLSNTGTR